MTYKSLLLFSCILFSFITPNRLFSQKYIPIDTTKHEKRDLFVKEFAIRNELFVKDIKSKYDSKTSKYIINNYLDFSKDFSTEIKKGSFIFEDEITDYVYKILDEIKIANPELSKYNFKILISKSHSLNAYCIVDGTFVINIGLFYWLDNEDQLAGVLSHEIAHKVLEHSLKKQEKDFQNNKISKEKLSSLKKEKYNISDKALAIFKERLYESGEQAKKHEFQSDSLGYVFYRKTKYSKSEFIEALKFMQEYDSIKPIGLEQKVYKKYFDLPEQKFKEEWLLKEDFSSYDYSKLSEKINADSISSHPEISDRIEKIKNLFSEVNQEVKSSNSNKELYSKISNIAYMETIPNLYFDEQYGLSIYVGLLYLEREEKNDSFFKEWIGKSFLKIYDARKNYTLNRYLERLVPKEQSESYQQFLSFMWNLKLDEIKKIADYYTVKEN